MHNRKVIGLVGGMCSGKDTWADFFESQFGYTKVSTSDMVRDYIKQNNIGEPTRDNTRVIASRMRALMGDDYLVRSALLRFPYEDIIFSGLYTVAEARCIKGHRGILVKVDADENTRFSRMLERGRAGEYPSKEEYRRLTNNDLRAADTDQSLSDVLQMADASIDGNIPISDITTCRRMAIKVIEVLYQQRDRYV